jgi:hypothetical protein
MNLVVCMCLMKLLGVSPGLFRLLSVQVYTSFVNGIAAYVGTPARERRCIMRSEAICALLASTRAHRSTSALAFTYCVALHTQHQH